MVSNRHLTRHRGHSCSMAAMLFKFRRRFGKKTQRLLAGEIVTPEALRPVPTAGPTQSASIALRSDDRYQQSSTVPVPLMPRTPVWVSVRLPHSGSALAGAVVRVKVLAALATVTV